MEQTPELEPVNDMVVLHSDSLKINGPKVDNSWTISLNVGEYEKGSVAKLLMLPDDSMYEVVIRRVSD